MHSISRRASSPGLAAACLSVLLAWLTPLGVAALEPGTESAPAATELERLETRFIEALVADDLLRLRDLAEKGTFGTPSWHSPIDVVERLDRITVGSRRWSSAVEGDTTLLRLEVDGTGRTLGGGHETVPLPRYWVLEAVATKEGVRLRAALTVERWLALQRATSDAAGIETLLAGQTKLDRHRFGRDLAELAAESGDRGRAAAAWALADATSRGDVAGQAWSHRALGRLEVIERRHVEILSHAERGLAAAERSGDLEVLAAAHLIVGNGYWLRGDVRTGIAHMTAGAQRIEETPDPRTAMRSLYMAGLLQTWDGQLAAAMESMDRLRSYLDRWPWLRGEIDLGASRGLLYNEVGNWGAASESFRRAEDSALQMGEGRVAAMMAVNRLTLSPMVAPSADAESPARVAELARRHLSGGERATALGIIATTLVNRGEITAIDSLLDEALSLAVEVNAIGAEAVALRLRGEVHRRRGQLAESLADVRQALAISLPGRLSSYHMALGETLHALGRNDEAEAAFRSAIDELEQDHTKLAADELGRSMVLAARGGPYRAMVDLMVTLGRVDEALVFAEKARARGLRDALTQGKIDLSAALSDEEKSRQAKLEEVLSALNQQVVSATDTAALAQLTSRRNAARLDLERFRTEVYIAHPSLRPPPIATNGDETQQWARAIPPGGVAIEMSVGEHQTIALLARRGIGEQLEVRARRLAIGSKELSPRIELLATQLAVRDPRWAATAEALYADLVLPLEEWLVGADTLCIIPDGVLWRIPFQVLRDASGRELIDRLPIFRAPSLAVLALSADRLGDHGGSRLLAMGNPELPTPMRSMAPAQVRGIALGPLPEAESEVRAIARLFGGQTETRVGSAATERGFKDSASSFDVIHLATHGIVDDTAPLFSAVLLGARPGDAEDGLLEARELAQLDLAAHLVVLSACDTGRGAIRPGEGLVGLSWALLSAGVPTAVVSDWKAESFATERLMVPFYRELRAGRGIAAAMRRAQIELRRDPRYSEPYYWAAFSAIGWAW